MVEQAKALVESSQPEKGSRVKGTLAKAPKLELVPAHLDAKTLSTSATTVSKRKRSLTVERTKSATLIRLGDTARDTSSKTFR